MTQEEFRRAIKLGLGRAVLWLRHNPWRPHQEAIEHACLHNTAYDPQCEGSRAEYVYEIVNLTDDRPRFAEVIIDGLSRAQEHWDVHNLTNLAYLLALDGMAGAKEAIYQKFIGDDAEGRFLGAEQIVRLDGIDGLLFVLDRIGRWLESNPEHWVDDWFLRQSKEQLGGQAEKAVSEAAAASPHVRKYIEASGRQRKGAGDGKGTPVYHRFTYPQLRELLHAGQGKVPRGGLFVWGKRASDEALRDAAADLLEETDSHRLIAYLRLFEQRSFPLDPRRLIELAASDHGEVATAARRALRHLRHDSIRAFALGAIAQGRADSDVARLFVKNYVPGDHVLLESLLDLRNSEDDLHWMCHAVVEVFEENAEAEALACMVSVYERCRCSLCRGGAVKVLMKRNACPTWMLVECEHDSNPNIRKLVRGDAVR